MKDSQHDQAGQVGEGVVWDVCDAVEGQREGLQIALVLQGSHWDLGQAVIIQPQVPELLQAFKAVLWHNRDVVRIQAPAERERETVNWIKTRTIFSSCERDHVEYSLKEYTTVICTAIYNITHTIY